MCYIDYVEPGFMPGFFIMHTGSVPAPLFLKALNTFSLLRQPLIKFLDFLADIVSGSYVCSIKPVIYLILSIEAFKWEALLSVSG